MSRLKLYETIFNPDRVAKWMAWKGRGDHPMAQRCSPRQKTAWKDGTATINGYLHVWLPRHPKTPLLGYVAEHVLICELVFGKFLPPKAIPHHVNEVKTDNRQANLVLCEDRAYHNLLHKRMRALKQCGHADWLLCKFCHKWDNPKLMYVSLVGGTTSAWHRRCICEYAARKRVEAGLPAYGRVPSGPHIDRREFVRKICGHPDWIKCSVCGVYDNPENLYVYRTKKGKLRGDHRACRNAYRRKWKARLKLRPALQCA